VNSSDRCKPLITDT